MKMSQWKRSAWQMSVSGFGLAILPSPAQAQAQAQPSTTSQSGTSTSGVADIVVTAQRRAENVQSVPLAVTALGNEALTQRGATTVQSLFQSVPSLNVTEQLAQARVTLRGIGVDNLAVGAESSIAFNQDGVFFARSAAALASFYDVARVEVLRGPQGTLYGRNATGGSVNIITNGPTNEFQGGIRATVGNYSTINTEGYVSGALSSDVAARLAFQTQHHSGYGRNIVNGRRIDSRDSQALRGQVRFKPSNRLTILLGGDYFQSDDSSNGFHYFGDATAAPALGVVLGGASATNPRDIASAYQPRAKAKFYGGRLEARYDFDGTNSIRSLSAYRRSGFDSQTDLAPNTFPLFPLFIREKSNQYSQEFQFNSETSRNKFVAGLYYLNESVNGYIKGQYFNVIPVFPGVPLNQYVQGFYAGGNLKTEAVAGYAQDTYSLTDSLRVTLGARYSWEKKRVRDQFEFDFATVYSPRNQPTAPFVSNHKTFKAFTPKIGIDVDLAPRVLAYASFSKGFKAGTFNLGSSTPALNPEKVNAYEAGLKSTLFDGRLRANISGFYYDYTDLQVAKVRGPALVLENAATARIYGVEGEFVAKPFGRDFQLDLTTSWLHARFRRYVSGDPSRPGGDGVTLDNGQPAFNLAGNTLPQAPNYTVTLGAEYGFDVGPGRLKIRGESFWSDRVYFSQFNRNTISQPSYNLQNIFINFDTTDKRWFASAYVRNIRDRTIRASGQVTSGLVGFGFVGFVQPPRTYGVTIGRKF